LPEPDPAKIAMCRRIASNWMLAVSFPSTDAPIGTRVSVGNGLTVSDFAGGGIAPASRSASCRKSMD
jgi:hypothetical protein